MTKILTDEQANYWSELSHTFVWKKKWDTLISGDFIKADVKWFNGGELNITENCLDRHLEDRRQKKALIFEPNNPDEPSSFLTYGELHLSVCRFANLLKNRGVGKGDIVSFYMGMTPELMIGILACARIGAIHTVVFGGFSPLSLRGRLEDSNAKMVVTHDGAYRGDKTTPLKDMVDEAVEGLDFVKTVLVVKRTHQKITMKEGRDYYYDALIKGAELHCPATPVKSEDPLFILYTSGSTGKPKGLVHTTAGYMVHVGKSFKDVFQYKENDIFFCTADIGWVTGHSYLTYGPLLNGATTVMFEGVPTYPNADRLWQIIEKHKITHLYTAPTAIRALEKFGHEIPEKYKMPTLKVLGSVGEPINEEAWHWYDKYVGKGRCPIVDTWWQTETGGIMISPIAGITKLKPSHATLPLPGIDPILMDEKGTIITEMVASGNLCIRAPWPSLARTIYGDHERFIQTYFSTYPGYYFTGDGAKRDADGYFRITGRVDDVINVSGHRIGTAEVEDAINEHPDIVESAVVGLPHPVKGQGLYAFVIPTNTKRDPAELEKEIKDIVQKIIGPIAKPDLIQVTEGLPKTRSGKIMRRILRKIVENDLENIGDISTLLNPEIVEKLIAEKKSFS
ncbi:acetate--CoA ligase [Bacteriovorax sp. PP10]|uniref:Acetate--CoA ligase n=1 Tax=Bacteriovorax antarcticus TaxID=3088717 RepID=A0ABU5VY95_9BACT|nr:acetate--CoA ligase [Bacteriovorax sp. PP10]MEA9358038.1 acetate--CoA ligase [Bacteriovorax sp. PP10]